MKRHLRHKLFFAQRVGLDEYFVALEFCDRPDGALWWWCVVAVDGACKLSVYRLFDFGRGVDFVGVGVFDRVCIVRLDFDQFSVRVCF